MNVSSRSASGTACPLRLAVPGFPEKAGEVARAHPDLNLIVDHLALPQPPQSALHEDPFERLLGLLTSARLPNVSVKLGGAPTMSRELCPYLDLWPSLLQVVDVFGPQRLMSASDVTRCLWLHTYAEAIGYLRDAD